MKRRTLLSITLSFLVLGTIRGLSAADDAQLDGWKTSHQEAWRAAQSEQRPMLMYITTQNCFYCRKMVEETLSDHEVARDIQARFVPVSLPASSNRILVRKLHVKSYPTTVIISPKSVVLDYMSGYVSPEEMQARLATAARKSSAVH